MKRPNILLITTDQQRFDGVGCNNPGFLRTPHLDRIAESGVNFTRAYCPAAVCTPSRVSIMSGQHLSRHGSYNVGVQPTCVDRFLSAVLAREGYWTAHIGKGHWYPFQTRGSPEEMKRNGDGYGSPYRNFAGFDHAELAIGHSLWGTFGHYEYWLRDQGIDPETVGSRALFEDDLNDTSDWDLPSRFHSGEWTVQRALQLLEKRDSGDPFFLHLGFEDPHHPHALPGDFRNRVDPDALPDPIPEGDRSSEPPHVELFRNDELQESRFRGRFDMGGQGRTFWRRYFSDSKRSTTTRSYYYSMIHLMDEQIGRLMGGLRRLELLENTLIVFTSDHGDMLGDHGIGQKGPLSFESVLRVPLFLSGAGFREGARCDVPVSLVDLYPTILGLAALEPDSECDGENLVGISNGNPSGRAGVRVEYKEEADRIRYKTWIEKDWKLTLYPGEAFGELYHLGVDPTEQRNRFEDSDVRDVRLRMTQALLKDLERSEPANPRLSRV